MIQYRFVSLAYVDSLYINEIRLFVPFARCCSPPSAPPGGHYGTSICPPLARRLPAACPPLARRLPAACPPLPHAAYGGLYQGRSAGYFIPRPPSRRRRLPCGSSRWRTRRLAVPRCSRSPPLPSAPKGGALITECACPPLARRLK